MLHTHTHTQKHTHTFTHTHTHTHAHTNINSKTAPIQIFNDFTHRKETIRKNVKKKHKNNSKN
jgi:hypothetical protein